MVVHEVAYDFDAADVDRFQVRTKDVEVPATAVRWGEVYARFQDHLAISLRLHRLGDGVENLGPGQPELGDIEA
jgi:hypothetical protein